MTDETDTPAALLARAIEDVKAASPVAALERAIEAATTPAAAFAAWRALESQVDDLRHAWNPVEHVVVVLRHHLGESGALLRATRAVSALADRIDAALDAGANDPDDPFVRLKDFKLHGKLNAAGLEGYAYALVTGLRRWPDPVEPLPEAHPLRQFPPYILPDGGGAVVLFRYARPEPPRWVRLSAVRATTAAAVELQTRDQRDREATAAAELAAKAEQARTLRRHLAALESELQPR